MALLPTRWHIAGVLVLVLVMGAVFQSARLMAALMWDILVLLLMVKVVFWTIHKLRRET